VPTVVRRSSEFAKVGSLPELVEVDLNFDCRAAVAELRQRGGGGGELEVDLFAELFGLVGEEP
jgi:hypothetical protein